METLIESHIMRDRKYLLLDWNLTTAIDLNDDIYFFT